MSVFTLDTIASVDTAAFLRRLVRQHSVSMSVWRGVAAGLGFGFGTGTGRGGRRGA
jgi:hypothetical protein